MAPESEHEWGSRSATKMGMESGRTLGQELASQRELAMETVSGQQSALVSASELGHELAAVTASETAVVSESLKGTALGQP